MSHAMPSRRHVVRSAAWAVPVVTTSIAAPALIYFTWRGAGNQAIFISDLTFDAPGC
jgi:hypothetical protein